MKWLEVHIDTNHTGLETVEAFLSAHGIDNVIIDDEGEFRAFVEENRACWGEVDEDLIRQEQGRSRVTFYLEETDAGFAALAALRIALTDFKKEHGDCGSLLMTHGQSWRIPTGRTTGSSFTSPWTPVGSRLIVIPELGKGGGVPEGRVASDFGSGSDLRHRQSRHHPAVSGRRWKRHVHGAAKRCWIWAAAAAFCPSRRCCWERTAAVCLRHRSRTVMDVAWENADLNGIDKNSLHRPLRRHPVTDRGLAGGKSEQDTTWFWPTSSPMSSLALASGGAPLLNRHRRASSSAPASSTTGRRKCRKSCVRPV
jgi:ribosomal protein L11 methyltransferase